MIANLVAMRSVTVGAGDFFISGISGWRTFLEAFGLNVSFRYCIRHQTTSQYEVGIGHLSDSTTLVRDTVVESSDSGSKVVFIEGEKSVNCVADQAYLSFDNLQFLGNPKSFPLSGYRNRIKLTIDPDNIDSDLTGVDIFFKFSTEWTIPCNDFIDHMVPKLPKFFRFHQSDGEDLNPVYWTDTTDYPTGVQDESYPIAKVGSALEGAIFSKFFMEGDFDVTCEISLSSYTATNSWSVGLSAYFLNETDSSGYDIIMIRRQYSLSAHAYQLVRRIDNTWSTIATVSTTDTTFRLRMKRSGRNAYGFIWDYTNSTWDYVGTYAIDSFSTNAFIRIDVGGWGDLPDTYAYVTKIDILQADGVKWKADSLLNGQKLAVTTDDGETEVPVVITDDWSEEVTIWLNGVDVSSSEETVFYLYYDTDADDNSNVSDNDGVELSNSTWRQHFWTFATPESLDINRNIGNLIRLLSR